MSDLGTLPGGNGDSEAYDINVPGQVVGIAETSHSSTGKHAFLYSNGVMSDLNSLIDPSCTELISAYGISDNGLITANGYKPGQVHARLLTPASKPILSSLSPASAPEGGSAFTLTINGANFTPNSLIRWDGEPQTTTFVSSSKLTVAIPTYYLANARTVPVSVITPQMGASTMKPFAIGDVTPPITTASVSGTAGTNGWFIGSLVTATLSATDNGGTGVAATYYYKTGDDTTQIYNGPFTLSGDGSYTVTFYSVDNRNNWETAHSVSVNIDATPPSTTYAVTTGYVTLYPTDATSGVAVTYFSLDGSTFAPYLAPQHFYGNHTIKFYSMDNAGNTEAAHTASISVSEPVPSLANLSPASANAGGAGFTLTVNGSNFTRYTVIKWNGASLTTSFVSANQVTAQVPAADIASAGSSTLIATNPAPGGGTSNAQTFTITGLKVTVTSRTRANTGVITLQLSVKNTGSAALQNVKITAAKLGGYSTTKTLPLTLGTLTGGASASRALIFSGAAGTAGSSKTLVVSGTYTGGTFSNSQPVILP